MQENWKSVAGYEGLYEVSDLGRVRNAKSGRMLKPCRHKLGYMSVMLYKEKEPRRHNIHRLVAMAFIDNPNGFGVVNHIDENKANNKVDNLEWCSVEHNMRHGTLQERLSNMRGHDGRNKKPVAQIREDGQVVKIFESVAQASRETKTARASIYLSCRGNNKKANGFYWSYAT